MAQVNQITGIKVITLEVIGQKVGAGHQEVQIIEV